MKTGFASGSTVVWTAAEIKTSFVTEEVMSGWLSRLERPAEYIVPLAQSKM